VSAADHQGCDGPGQKPGTRCGGEIRARGKCDGHYSQQRRGVYPLQPLGGPGGRRPEGDTASEPLHGRVKPARKKVLERRARERGMSLHALVSAILAGTEQAPPP